MQLNSREQGILRKLLAELTPIPKAPPAAPVRQVGTGDTIERLTASAKQLRTIDPNVGSFVLAKLMAAGVLLDGEKLMEFYSRVGLGKNQIETMSKQEIREFCDRVKSNNDDVPVPHTDIGAGTVVQQPVQRIFMVG